MDAITHDIVSGIAGALIVGSVVYYSIKIGKREEEEKKKREEFRSNWLKEQEKSPKYRLKVIVGDHEKTMDLTSDIFEPKITNKCISHLNLKFVPICRTSLQQAQLEAERISEGAGFVYLNKFFYPHHQIIKVIVEQA